MKSLLSCFIAITCFFSSAYAANKTSHPNVIIILCDDLGYGDLSCQGHPVIRTPNIDNLAAEGQRWTSFYASASLCNPSRVALMTGRMPIRINKTSRNQWGPMPASEITIGNMFQYEGYATAYIGKWGITNYYLKNSPPHPNDAGFDYFFGLEGSNDGPLREGFKRTYDNIKNAKSEDFRVPLFRQKEIIEDPVYQPLLTRTYTEESIKWIVENSNKQQPFLLILGHTMPHVPLFASPDFKGKSKAGIFGDVVEEIDWSVGEIIKTLKKVNADKNTLVIFTSDNGPWLTYHDLGGSSGPLRDGKITSWEGGFRVPCIFWYPDKISAGVIDELGCNVDFFSTLAKITGAELPQDRIYDSYDLSPVLLKNKPSPRKEMMYYGQPGNIWAYRYKQYKVVFESWDSMHKEEGGGWRGYDNRQKYETPLLFNLNTELAERNNIAKEQPQQLSLVMSFFEECKRKSGAVYENRIK